MEFVFAYLAGLLTLINPCILPVLPIAIVSSLNGHRLGPVALVAGLSIVFTTVGVVISSIGPSIGITESTMATAGAVLMMVFGTLLLVPGFTSGFGKVMAGVSDSANQKMNDLPSSGLLGQFLGGGLLGLVWSPCIGPTLGGAIALASSGGSLAYAATIMFGFSLGVASIILALAYGARGFFMRNQERMRMLASKSNWIIGLTFLSIGLLLFFNVHHIIDAWLLDVLPHWLTDLSVSL